MALSDIPTKTNRVLRIILVAFLAIVIRVWHLGVVQREEMIKESQKPQQRTILVRADRGTICDRFHKPLALNRISYNAAIYYNQIAQIPSISWKVDGEGNRVRVYARKEYIRELSSILAKTLDLDADRVEDLIHSKASLFPHAPYILKSALTEDEHYRLKMLEKDWVGVQAEIAAERYYPMGKTGCHLIGTMGAINHKEYNRVVDEIWALQQTIDLYEEGVDIPLPEHFTSFEEVYKRYNELKEKAYTLNALVGKSGIEGKFEEELRGFYGKKIFEVDQKGECLRELSGGKPAFPGRQIVLTISAELQEFAESLLNQNEKIRDGRSLGVDPADKKRKVQKQPWIKGGAIVAIEPNTGEILALASTPRFDPNDFIPSTNSALRREKQRQICRWLENETFIASIWDGKEQLSRERTRQFVEESQPLTWEFTLELMLPLESPVKAFFTRYDDIKSAIQLQEDFEELLYYSKISDAKRLVDVIFDLKSPDRKALQSIPEAAASLKRLEAQLSLIPHNGDKLFAIDLCRAVVYSPSFNDSLITAIGSTKIAAYRSLVQAFQRVEERAKPIFQEKFHETEFQVWKQANQKEFLAAKRAEEKEKKTYARPYLDYLDGKEKELFAQFWEEHRLSLLLTEVLQQSREPKLRDFCKNLKPELAQELLHTFRSFSQMKRPLYGTYKGLRGKEEKDLAASFYPLGGFGFSRSSAFQSGSAQGSLFKLVTSFEALRQGQSHVLSLVDEFQRDPKNVGYMPNGTPYPRFYKGGRLPRSHAPMIGFVDFMGAIEQSSNCYFSILVGDYFKDPEDLARAARWFGYGQKTGVELPGEFRGNVPTDLKENRTGIYSTAIGQHTLLSTPLQSSLMIAAIANGGSLLKPNIVKEVTGFSPDREPLHAFAFSNFFAKNELEAIGIQFPLFTAIQARSSIDAAQITSPEIRGTVPLTPQIRSTLLDGMDRAVWGAKGSARPSAIKQLLSNPILMREYNSLQHQMLGKTSTAEVVSIPSVLPSSLPQIYKNIWFGAISFPELTAKNRWDHPELVVVVFLRYGDGGKESAPLAAQMIRKWREIKQKYKEESWNQKVEH